MAFKFTVAPEFADVAFAAGGRAYKFTGGELAVEELADARRVRVFALEQAHLGIAEDGDAIEPEPAPEPEPTGFLRDTAIASLTRAALVEIAAARGVETDGLTKAQIRAALAAGQEV